MTAPAEKKLREPMKDRLRRLGLHSTPGKDPVGHVFRTKRFYRELDEITFNKPNPNKTK
jgi:hypothetical protein